MKTKKVFLLLLIIPVIGYTQEFRKWGVGVGYRTTSIVGDSVRPFEISFRYRISDKHTVQVYAPLWLKKYKHNNQLNKPDFMKQEHYDIFNHTWTHSLWGVGVGYDYSFYSYSYFNFFAGVSADFQEYKYKEDYHNIDYKLAHAVYNRPTVYEDYYKEEVITYYWNKTNGINLIPNTGIRFSTSKITAEAKINICLSYLSKSARYSSKLKNILYEEWNTWDIFYPKSNEVKVHPNLSLVLSYYF